MEQIIQQFLTSFEGSIRNVHPQWQKIDQLAAEGKTEVLHELGVALEAHAERFRSKLWAIESVYDHLERVLALTPGRIYAHTLMKLLLLPRTRTMQSPVSLDEHSRMLAPLLASAQSTSVLLDLIEAYRHNLAYTEFICVLVQEMVLRGVRCDETPLIVDFIDRMREAHHSLAWLPLKLLEIENSLPLPLNFIAGSCFAYPKIEMATVAEEETSSESESEMRVAIEERTTLPERDRILAAVDPWANARMEARIFALEHYITSTQVSDSLILSLNLDCVKGVSIDDIFLGVLSPQNAFRLLFIAAAQGGAYGGGYNGAYGRLATWYSLAGLVGAPNRVSVQEVASLIVQSTWFSFTANSDWFYKAAPMWDVGIITLRSDRRSIAVLAATSTD